MNSKSHALITSLAIKLYESISKVEIQDKEDIVYKCVKTDKFEDLEFVSVEGILRDDPHKEDVGRWYDIDVEDKSSYFHGSRYYTAFNHFIDIRKGMEKAIFDDYDGYSYGRGSGSKEEHQLAKDATNNYLEWIIGAITKWKVDKAIMKWFEFEREYVHTPVSPSYNKCSLSIERYCFNGDKGKYSSYLDELLARFPLASSFPDSKAGIPYSVFMPVDNMARYWYSQYEQHKILSTLGPVFHAFQDAIIPHHAAGCLGNWHGEYENELDIFLPSKVKEPDFRDKVKALFNQWVSDEDKNPPNELKMSHIDKRPSISWRIDFLVTWLAINAYNSYENIYNNFAQDYSFNEEDALDLTQKVTAMCMLMLKKASLSI